QDVVNLPTVEIRLLDAPALFLGPIEQSLLCVDGEAARLEQVEHDVLNRWIVVSRSPDSSDIRISADPIHLAFMRIQHERREVWAGIRNNGLSCGAVEVRAQDRPVIDGARPKYLASDFINRYRTEVMFDGINGNKTSLLPGRIPAPKNRESGVRGMVAPVYPACRCVRSQAGDKVRSLSR